MNPDQITQPTSTPISAPNPQINQQGQSFLNALKTAQQDPNSSFANELRTRIQSGQMNDYAKSAGVDISRFLTPPPSPSPASNTTTGENPLQTFGNEVGSAFNKEQNDAGNLAQRTLGGGQVKTDASGQPIIDSSTHESIGRGIIDALGIGSGFLNSVLGSATKAVWNMSVPKSVSSAIASTASTIAQNSPVIRSALDAAGKGIEAYNQWKQTANPKDVSTMEAFTNFPLAVLNAYGIESSAKAIPSIVEKGGVLADQAVQGAKDLASGAKEGLSNMVKYPISAAQDLATPIDKNVMTILQNPTTETERTLKNMFSQAKNAVSETGSPTPFDVVGKNNFGSAMKSLNQKLTSAGELKDEALKVSGSKPVNLSLGTVDATTGKTTESVADSFLTDVKEKLGTIFDAKGNLIDAPNRSSVIANSASDTKLVNLVKNTLQKLGSSPTLQQVNDAVDSIQGQIYKSKVLGAEPINGTTEGLVKEAIGKLNNAAKEVGGDSYIKANSDYSRLINLKNDLNARLGNNMKNAGSMMKRIFSPQDGGIKTLVQNLESETGQPIFHDATLAKFAMDAVGDPRAQSLLQQGLEAKSKGIIKSTIDYIQSKLENPEGKAIRVIQKAKK